MKSGDTYRFTLSWQTETEDQIIAGEFLDKLGNKKSKFIIQLIGNYIKEHSETITPQETMQFIINSTSVGNTLTETIRSIIQSEFAGKINPQTPVAADLEQINPNTDDSINDMLGNLDVWDI